METSKLAELKISIIFSDIFIVQWHVSYMNSRNLDEGTLISDECNQLYAYVNYKVS